MMDRSVRPNFYVKERCRRPEKLNIESTFQQANIKKFARRFPHANLGGVWNANKANSSNKKCDELMIDAAPSVHRPLPAPHCRSKTRQVDSMRIPHL